MTKLHTTRRAMLGAMAAAPVALAIPGAAVAANPDAELLAMYARWDAAVTAYNADSDPDTEEDDHPLNVEWTQAYRAMDNAPAPQTVAGIVALLRYFVYDGESNAANADLAKDGTLHQIAAHLEAERPNFQYGEQRLPWVALVGALTIAERRV